MKRKRYTPKAIAIVKAAKMEVEKLRKAGWTRQDFARELGKMLGIDDKGADPMKNVLDPFQQWMVKSNLERIKNGEMTGIQAVASLKAQGYELVAAALEKALVSVPKQ